MHLSILPSMQRMHCAMQVTGNIVQSGLHPQRSRSSHYMLTRRLGTMRICYAHVQIPSSCTLAQQSALCCKTAGTCCTVPAILQELCNKFQLPEDYISNLFACRQSCVHARSILQAIDSGARRAAPSVVKASEVTQGHQLFKCVIMLWHPVAVNVG